jgi:hypothetical protein
MVKVTASPHPGYTLQYKRNFVRCLSYFRQPEIIELVSFPGNEDYITARSYKKEAAAAGSALLFVRPFIRQI